MEDDDDEDGEDKSITFIEVNNLPRKNVDNKCLVYPGVIVYMIVTLVILIVVSRKLFIPENCLIDSVSLDKKPVCLQCDEFYDLNSTNLC